MNGGSFAATGSAATGATGSGPAPGVGHVRHGEILTRAVVARRVNEPVAMETIVLEPPGPGEVLVRMEASGICHSDLHYKHGAIGDDFPF